MPYSVVKLTIDLWGRKAVPEWMFKKGERQHSINLLALDSKLDSGVFGIWQVFKNIWKSYTSFFSRFHLTGYRKLLNEALSEGFNLGVAGMVLMAALCIPSVRIIEKGDWLARGELSVTFLDRYGNEIGHRGDFT